jgi:protein-tyrosine phosphatase
MAGHPGQAWVIHCHAGKDRTGMVAALLLTALGVERELVLDDYELTGRYRVPSTEGQSFASLVERGANPEAAIGLMGAPRWAMAQALEALDGEHGGIETFLLGPAGMSSEELGALRNALVH